MASEGKDIEASMPEVPRENMVRMSALLSWVVKCIDGTLLILEQVIGVDR